MIKSEESDFEELPNTPPQILAEPETGPPESPLGTLQEGSSATLTALSGKSRRRYDREYELFMEWRKQKKLESLTENNLLEYFTEKAKIFKSSSLWVQFSMLKATLLINNNTDISQYSRLTAFLKRQSAGYKANSIQSKTFTKAQINKFLLEAPDENYLLLKVVLIMGISGACRQDELCKMTVDDIQDAGSVLVVRIPDSEVRASRTFIITGEVDSALNPVEIYRKYASLRPRHASHPRFFLYYKGGKCSVQVVGIHTFSKMPYHIAKYLQLPEPSAYTGQCFRKTSASLQATYGADIVERRLWKTTTITRNCEDVFMDESPQISASFDTTTSLNSTTMDADYNEIFVEEHPPLTADCDSAMPLIPEADIKVEKETPNDEGRQNEMVTCERTKALPRDTFKFTESIKNMQRRFGSASKVTTSKENGIFEDSGLTFGAKEVENFKNEIVQEVRQEIRKAIRKEIRTEMRREIKTEIRKEISKMKQDILDAIKSELRQK